MQLAGLNYVLTNFAQLSVSARIWLESLILGAWVVHTINWLHHRPDDRQTSLKMLDIVTYHVPTAGDDDSSDDNYDDEPATTPVGYSQGLFFLGDIVLDDHVWRLCRTNRMDTLVAEDLPRIYNCSTRNKIKHRLGHAAGLASRKVNP